MLNTYTHLYISQLRKRLALNDVMRLSFINCLTDLHFLRDGHFFVTLSHLGAIAVTILNMSVDGGLTKYYKMGICYATLRCKMNYFHQK